MKHYSGRREGHAVIVTVDGRRLNPRFDLWNHSPTGFEWGYAGSGPAQLALAILADHLGNDEQTLNFYQRYKWAIVAELPHREWILTSDEIDQALQAIRNQEMVAGGCIVSTSTIPMAKFRLGKIVSTPNALEQLTQDDIVRAIGRHQAGDWGDVNEDDRTKNELSLAQGLRLWSVYHTGKGVKFWLITEANRSATTVLMPEDY